MVSTGLCLFVVAFICVWWARTRRRNQSMTRKVATLPGALPIIGHLHLFSGMYREALKSSKFGYENGGILKLWIGPSLVFIVTDPGIARKVLNICLKKAEFYKFAASWVGQGLVTADVSYWKHHRKIIQPTFNQFVLDGFIDIFNRRSEVFVANLKPMVGKGEFEHQPFLARFTLESICETAIGLPEKDVDAIMNEEYGRAVHRIAHIYFKRFRIIWQHCQWLYKWTSNFKEEIKTVKILKAMTNSVLQKKKAAMMEAKYEPTIASSGNRCKTFMDLLLEIGAEGSLTDQEIGDEIDTMLMAGFDTSSTALLYIMLQLKRYPEVQDKVHREIQEIFNGTNRAVTKDDLSQLVYMEAVIKETLRVYPIAPMIVREAECDVKLDDFTVPAGSNIWINVIGMHHHPIWGDPHEFRPERWLDPSTLPNDSSSFAAFSLGKRGCIGKGYAMMSMKIVLVHMLRAYKITGTNQKIVSTIEIVLKALSGNVIQIEYR